MPLYSRFTSDNSFFPGGELRLTCSAEIEGVWKTHVEGLAMGGGKRRVASPGVTSVSEVTKSADLNTASGLSQRDAKDEPNHLLVRNSGDLTPFSHVCSF